MNIDEQVENALLQLFMQSHAQFGDAVRAYWFNDSDDCPGCGRRVNLTRFKSKEAISLNAFIYRERGVLIGYFLCDRCVKKVFADAKRNPYRQTELHTAVEANLIKAYKKHMHSMDA